MTAPGQTLRAQFVASGLNGWANQQVCRFGHGTRVYLVGSFLERENARDIDIRVVVPDHLFWMRYRGPNDVDCEIVEGAEGRGAQDWDVFGRWTPDMIRYGREASTATKKLFMAWASILGPFALDLQIIPESEQEKRYKDRPRLRIDSPEMDAAEAP